MLLPCIKALDGEVIPPSEGPGAGPDTGPGPTGAGGETGMSGAGDMLAADGPGLIVGGNATGAGGDITGGLVIIAGPGDGATMMEGGIEGA